MIPEYIYVRKITKFIESESKFITNADGELQIIHLNRFCTLWSPMIERSFILSPFVVHVYIFILKPLMEQCVKNIIAGILLLRRKSYQWDPGVYCGCWKQYGLVSLHLLPLSGHCPQSQGWPGFWEIPLCGSDTDRVPYPLTSSVIVWLRDIVNIIRALAISCLWKWLVFLSKTCRTRLGVIDCVLTQFIHRCSRFLCCSWQIRLP